MTISKKAYDAPKIVAREDLKQITLYTGFGRDPRAKQGGRDLFWHAP